MATRPKTTLLKEALAALKAVKALNFAYLDDKDEDPQMYRAFKRCDRVLNKAAKTESA